MPTTKLSHFAVIGEINLYVDWKKAYMDLSKHYKCSMKSSSSTSRTLNTIIMTLIHVSNTGWVSEILYLARGQHAHRGKRQSSGCLAKGELERKFSMKELGEAWHILRILIERDRSWNILQLFSKEYVRKVIQVFSMKKLKPTRTPIPTSIQLSSTDSWTTWTHLWKAPGSLVFKQKRIPTVELVKTIWLQLVHTIKGQYDAIVGNSDVVMLKRSNFLQRWKHWPIFVLCHWPKPQTGLLYAIMVFLDSIWFPLVFSLFLFWKKKTWI